MARTLIRERSRCSRTCSAAWWPPGTCQRPLVTAVEDLGWHVIGHRSPARSLQRLQTISSSISLSRERERKAGGNRSRPLWTLGRWLTEERNIGEPAYDQASVTGRGTTLLARTKEKKGFARVRELSEEVIHAMSTENGRRNRLWTGVAYHFLLND